MSSNQTSTQATLSIGIDPDTVKSGVAVWNGKEFIDLMALDFWSTIQWLLDNRQNIRLIKVEGGWLNKTNWHTGVKLKDGKTLGTQGLAETGRRVGMNHQTGLLLVEFLEKFNFPFQVVRPLSNNWWAEDKQGKFNKMTGWTKKSNPEKRDAAMLVFGMK